MKLFFTLGVLIFGAVSVGFAQPSISTRAAEEAYIDQNAQELRQVRQQVDMAARSAPETAESRFTVIYDALDEAQQALSRLKNADKTEQPQRRRAFEEAKSKAVKLWRDFRLNEPPANKDSR